MLRDLSDTMAFLEVVQRGGFTAAALALRTSKARLSKKVQDLERKLGVTLLHRTTRKIRLTEAGSIYYTRCQSVASLIEDAESAVGHFREQPAGWLRVTAPHWLVTTILAEPLAGFRIRYPEVRLQLLLDDTVRDIAGDDIHVALRLWYGQMPDTSLVARRLAGISTGLYASPLYLARRGAPTDPSELKEHDCLVTTLFYSRPSYLWPLKGQNGLVDYPINPAIVATDPSALYEFLVRGHGIQLTSHRLVREAVERGELIRILPGWSGPEAGLHAVRAGGRVPSPAVKAFLEHLANHLGTVPREE